MDCTHAFLLRTLRAGLFSMAAAGAVLGLAPGGVASAGEGIQTRSIASAPASRGAANDSKPLSELNTPDAIAAREAAARAAPAAPRLPTAATAAAVLTARGAAPAVAANARPAAAPVATASAALDAHAKVEGLQKGAKVRVRSAALLRPRPNDVGDALRLPDGTEVELGAPIYNAGGYWFYATAGKDSGWLSQSDIAR